MQYLLSIRDPKSRIGGKYLVGTFLRFSDVWFLYGGSPYKFKITRLPVLTMFPWSPGEFKTGFVILEARAVRIGSQNFNPTRSTKK
jgi:hypothetical protein